MLNTDAEARSLILQLSVSSAIREECGTGDMWQTLASLYEYLGRNLDTDTSAVLIHREKGTS